MICSSHIIFCSTLAVAPLTRWVLLALLALPLPARFIDIDCLGLKELQDKRTQYRPHLGQSQQHILGVYVGHGRPHLGCYECYVCGVGTLFRTVASFQTIIPLPYFWPFSKAAGRKPGFLAVLHPGRWLGGVASENFCCQIFEKTHI